MFFFRQLHVLLLSMVAAAAAVAVLSICVDAVRMRLLWLSIICFVLFMHRFEPVDYGCGVFPLVEVAITNLSISRCIN